MEWSLFVDTDSLYIEVRKRYGSGARMDYLSLPLNVVGILEDINFFKEKDAMVMRHGKEWSSFVLSLERFGFNVVPTDRGMQAMTIGAQVVSMAQKAQGIVLVTASDRISPLLYKAIEKEFYICVSSFGKNPEVETLFADEKYISFIEMDDSWLWNSASKGY